MKRILIIDDDIDLLMLLERRLTSEGYYVETAASLTQAEEVIPAFAPHLLLLDINVKGEDGRQLCYKIKKLHESQDTKVIMMSGHDFNSRMAALFGADELLPKPFDVDFLLHRVEHTLMPFLRV